MSRCAASAASAAFFEKSEMRFRTCEGYIAPVSCRLHIFLVESNVHTAYATVQNY